MSGHTPIPWSAEENERGLMQVTGWDDNVRCVVASVNGDPDHSPARENAAFIVRAVNAHELLVAACKEAANALRTHLIVASPWGAKLAGKLAEALALAEPKEPARV